MKQELQVYESIAPTVEEFRKLPARTKFNKARNKELVNADNKVTHVYTLLDLLEKTQSKVKKENPGLAKEINDLKDGLAGNKPNKARLDNEEVINKSIVLI